MRNKWLKRGILFLAVGCLTFSMTGCKGKEILNTALDEIGDAAEPLTVEATTSDEGEITYQWYQSFTNTNGGGTIIEGATENTFTPPTKEAGIVYYYVVATSTIQNSTNRITSETAEVVVSEKTEAETAAENAEAPAETQEEQPEAPAETQPEQ